MTRSAKDWLDIARAQQARFWRKVDKNGPAHPTLPDLGTCWVWLTGKDKDGYGKFAITAPRRENPKQKHVRAHRLSYEMAHGCVATELVMLHSCDRPACVNPAHLKPGTVRENYADAKARDRNTAGERHPFRISPELIRSGDRHPMAILSEDAVARARWLHAGGASSAALARANGVSKSVMSAALQGRTWPRAAGPLAVPRPQRRPIVRDSVELEAKEQAA